MVSVRRPVTLECLEGRVLFHAGEDLQSALFGENAPTMASSSAILQLGEGEADSSDLIALAKAITASGAKFFGAGWCPHCTAQKQFFEDGQRYLPFVEVTNPDHSLNAVGIANNITTYPTWVFPDGTRLTTESPPEVIAARAGVTIPTGVSPSFFPLTDVTLQSGSPLWLALDGYDPNDDPLSFTATSDNPALVLPSIPTGNSSLRIKVKNFGEMTFELFDNLVPDLTAHIEELAQAGVFNTAGANSELFGTVVRSPELTAIGSIVPTAASGNSVLPVADEFDPDLQNNQAGLIGLSKGSDDTGNLQFFVLGAPARQLDFHQPIFGMLTEGESNRHNINDTTTQNDVPTRAVQINSAEVFQDTENRLLMLKAPAGASGQTNVTVTVDDGHGHIFSQTFHVTVVPDTANGGPFLNPVYAVPAAPNTPVTLHLTSQDVEGDPVRYTAEAIGDTASQVQVDPQNGVVTVTPPVGFTGTLQVRVAVQAAPGAPNDTFDPQDSEVVNILVTIDSRPWHNAASSLDVDQDGFIVAHDALYIINEINRRTARDINRPLLVPAPVTRLLYDTDADGYASPHDVLLIINELNRQSAAEGEGETISPLAALDLIFADLDPMKRRRPT